MVRKPDICLSCADCNTVPHLHLHRTCTALQASVFALYDEAKTLQYVGFSRALRDSLRTVFSRRPEKAHFYK